MYRIDREYQFRMVITESVEFMGVLPLEGQFGLLNPDLHLSVQNRIDFLKVP
jgi:hypothetical protein